MRKWSKAPRILSLLAVMIAAAVGFAPAAHAAEGDVMIGDSAYASVPEAVKAIVDKKEPQGSTIKLTKGSDPDRAFKLPGVRSLPSTLTGTRTR
ncbi:MAG: hypothetical protein ACLTSX_04515 [Collinsella sp.]